MVAEDVERGLELRTAGVIEVHVNAVGRAFLQVTERLAGTIVESVVHFQLVAQVGDLFGRAGAGQHATSVHFGELTCGATHGARASGYEHGSAVLQVGDAKQANPRRHSGHSEDSQIGGRRSDAYVDDLQLRPSSDKRFAPAEHAQDVGSDWELFILRRDHATDGSALKRFADLEWRNIGLDLVHPPTHVGIDRHVQIAHNHFEI